jgi:hypothetical protein
MNNQITQNLIQFDSFKTTKYVTLTQFSDWYK